MLYVMWNLENSLHNLHYVDLTLDSYDLFKSNEWQFHIINIVRRMADFHFHQAASWEEMEHIHRKWVRDYNSQRHWAHEQRTDGWHSVTRRIGLPRRQGNPSKNERQGYSSNPEAQRITSSASLPVLRSFDARPCSLRAPSGTLA